jgi:hypothetical protein
VTPSNIAMHCWKANGASATISKTARISSRKRIDTRGSTECSLYQSAASFTSRAAADRILYFTRTGVVGCAQQADEP